MTQIKIVKGDQNYNLIFTVKDTNGTVQDISGSTVHFKVADYGSTTSLVDITSSDTTSSGKATIDVGTHLSTLSVGNYDGEVEVRYSSGKVLTVPDIDLIVKEELS